MTVKQMTITLPDLIAFLRVQVRRGGFSIRSDEGIATCPAELMLNIDAILDAATRGATLSETMTAQPEAQAMLPREPNLPAPAPASAGGRT